MLGCFFSFPTRRSSDLGSEVEFLVGSVHDGGAVAAPARDDHAQDDSDQDPDADADQGARPERQPRGGSGDRKSTRLNSSHLVISYAVLCLKDSTDRETV